MDEGPQDILTAAQSSGLSSKSAVKPMEIVKSVIGQPLVFKISPDVLVGIKVRAVGGKPLDRQTMPGAPEKSGHSLGSMGLASIPQHDEGSSQMAQKLHEEGTRVRPMNASIGIESEVGSQTRPAGRDTDRRNRGDLLPVSAPVVKQGGLPSGSPGPSDHRQHGKSALVEEDQVGVESMGFFLYGANPGPAIAGRPFRCARRPGAPVFDNSSPRSAGSSRRDPGDTSLQSVCGSPAQSAHTSTGPSKSRAPLALAITVSPTAAFAPPSTGEDVPRRAWLSTLPLRFGHTHVAIDEPTVGRLPPYERPGWESARPPINLRLGGAAVPVPGEFHSVSYLIYRPLC